MDSDIRKRLAAASRKLSLDTDKSEPQLSEKQPRRAPRPWLSLGLATILILWVVLGYTIFRKPRAQTQMTIPTKISQQVSFPIYYPEPSKLPAGYTLDPNTFSAAPHALLYSVKYEKDRSIAFSIQARPSDEELDTFYANQLPLRDNIPTPIGDGVIGAIGGQTFVSIRAEGSWIIATAPADTDKEALKKILKTMRRE